MPPLEELDYSFPLHTRQQEQMVDGFLQALLAVFGDGRIQFVVNVFLAGEGGCGAFMDSCWFV